MMGFGLSIPITPLFLEEDIGITDPVKLKAWVGFIQSATAVTLAVFAPIWGHLADVFSRKAMLLRAMFGGAVIISLMAFVNAPWQLLVLKAIQGCFTGVSAAVTVVVAGITPVSQIGFALGLMQTTMAVGSSLGPMAGGILSDFFGYRAAFFCTGLTLGLSGIIVLIGVESDIKTTRLKQEEARNSEPIPADSSRPMHKKRFSLLPDFKPIINSPMLITMLLVSFGIHTANTTIAPMLPLFLKSLIIGDSGEAAYVGSAVGFVMGVGAASTAIAAVMVGKFSTRAGYWRTLIFCISAAAIATVPQTFVANIYQLAVLRAISAFFIGGTAPVINAIIAVSSKKETQGSVYGINASVLAAGNALGPLIGSAVAMVSYRAVFLTTAIILGISALQTAKRQKAQGGGS